MAKRNEDVAFALARNVVATNYEDISPRAVDVTKKCILDTLGVTLAASGMSQACKVVVDIVKEGGGIISLLEKEYLKRL